ncbi:unnamed protein product [Durusdinium trenchii]|uniref:PDZ domain-containing protein n=2 Tax=Durusdinium trenchii TaxID=1381693 RepID=A0ABP0N361_9DINO
MAEAENDFQASESFQGARPGYAFKMGPKGLGYYLDAKQGTKSFWAEAIAQLPETWREAPFREALLRVHAEKGCGVGMAHSAFGLVVETVDEVPGQDLQPGEVIVSIEGRVLASLSAPQMQASFQKRRLDGAKLLVGNHTQVKELSQRDPNIIQMWDPLKKHNYFFHKKSGRSAWTLEELQSKEGGAAASAPEAAKSSQAAPIDLSHFLQHGFAKQREPPPKKRPKAKASSQKEEEDGKDESDLARDDRGSQGSLGDCVANASLFWEPGCRSIGLFTWHPPPGAKTSTPPQRHECP